MRVTDYKTGACPRKPELIVIGGGAELQRALYALACRELLPGYDRIAARLLYLADEPRHVPLPELTEPCGKSATLSLALAMPDAGRRAAGVGCRQPAKRSAVGNPRFARLSAPQKGGLRESGRPTRGILGRAMTELADHEHRLRALTDLGATLLVEAAAGTGKTSLLAGRVVCLLATGLRRAKSRRSPLRNSLPPSCASVSRNIWTRCCPAPCRRIAYGLSEGSEGGRARCLAGRAPTAR